MNEMLLDAIKSVSIEPSVDSIMTGPLWQPGMVWTTCAKHTMAMMRSHDLRFRAP